MIGKTLGHYQVVEQLGAGGMGVVYRAHDTRLERDVALKVLPPGTLADESARKRFRKEALALSRLNHPNIATIHDFDTEGETDFIVMELIPGTRLDEKCGEQSNSQDELIRVGIQLAQGLGAAHAAGVLHRDLKPSNLAASRFWISAWPGCTRLPVRARAPKRPATSRPAHFPTWRQSSFVESISTNEPTSTGPERCCTSSPPAGGRFSGRPQPR